MKTLDEAIKYCNEEAEAWKNDVKRFDKVYKHGQAEATKKYADECAEEAEFHEQLAEWLMELKKLREENVNQFLNSKDIILALIEENKALREQRLQGEWIPIKTRPMTEEEKQNAIEKHDVDPDDLEYPFAWHFDCELPEPKEGEQSVDVLVTTHLGFVKVTNFFIDYLGCPCFEDMDEADEFVAWMPLPEKYEPKEKENG